MCVRPPFSSMGLLKTAEHARLAVFGTPIEMNGEHATHVQCALLHFGHVLQIGAGPTSEICTYLTWVAYPSDMSSKSEMTQPH